MIPIADGHLHVNPRGLGGLKVGLKFKRVGGWFMTVVSLPPTYYGLGEDLDSIIKSFNIHINECYRVRDSGIKVACLAGIHPAFIDSLIRHAGPSRFNDVMGLLEKALKELEKLRKEGIINGFGEFGRPHYKTLPESVIANEIILSKVFEIAKDYGGVIHLHLEQGGYLSVEGVDLLRRCSNLLDVRRVVFHHASINMAYTASLRGYSSTLIGRAEVLRGAFNKGLSSFIPESDYIDDPKRPGVVMYPWEIAEEVNRMIKNVGQVNVEEALNKVMVDNVIKLYDVGPP